MGTIRIGKTIKGLQKRLLKEKKPKKKQKPT